MRPCGGLETPSRAGELPELAQQLFEKCVERAGALGAALMTRLGTDCADGPAKGIAQYAPRADIDLRSADCSLKPVT